MQDIRAHEYLLRHTHYLVLSVAVEDDNIIYVRAIEEELILLQSRTDKAILAVDIQFLVGLHDGLDVDIGKVAHLSAARVFVAVFLLERLKPIHRIFRQVLQVIDGILDLTVDILHQLIRLLGIKTGDTNHAYLEQSLDIFPLHLAQQAGLERFQSLVNEPDKFLLIGRILIFGLLVDTILDEYLLQRSIEILLFQLAFLDLQLPFQECFGVVHRHLQ